MNEIEEIMAGKKINDIIDAHKYNNEHNEAFTILHRLEMIKIINIGLYQVIRPLKPAWELE
jgi:hypothetical protein